MFFRKKLIIDSICLDPQCSICGFPSAKIEITNAHSYPNDANSWSWRKLRSYNKYRDFNADYLIYSGPGGGNGAIGDPISIERKKAIIKAFTKPYDFEEIKNQFYDMAGFCIECNKFYCPAHWNVNTNGYGHCPEGHGKSLDPHWSPEME